MKISTNRKTRQYIAGDEVTAQIAECADKNGNLGMKLFILENGKPGNTFFYHSFGAYADKGRYYFEQFLNHLQVPEGLEIDEKWFIGKRVQVVLGERESPTDGKKYLNIASYVSVVDSSEVKAIDPFINGSDLTADIPFDDAKPVNKKEVKSPPKKKVAGENTSPTRPDFVALMDE